jgi:hypothetical protein
MNIKSRRSNTSNEVTYRMSCNYSRLGPELVQFGSWALPPSYAVSLPRTLCSWYHCEKLKILSNVLQTSRGVRFPACLRCPKPQLHSPLLLLRNSQMMSRDRRITNYIVYTDCVQTWRYEYQYSIKFRRWGFILVVETLQLTDTQLQQKYLLHLPYALRFRFIVRVTNVTFCGLTLVIESFRFYCIRLRIFLATSAHVPAIRHTLTMLKCFLTCTRNTHIRNKRCK